MSQNFLVNSSRSLVEIIEILIDIVINFLVCLFHFQLDIFFGVQY